MVSYFKRESEGESDLFSPPHGLQIQGLTRRHLEAVFCQATDVVLVSGRLRRAKSNSLFPTLSRWSDTSAINDLIRFSSASLSKSFSVSGLKYIGAKPRFAYCATRFGVSWRLSSMVTGTTFLAKATARRLRAVVYTCFSAKAKQVQSRSANNR